MLQIRLIFRANNWVKHFKHKRARAETFHRCTVTIFLAVRGNKGEVENAIT